MDINDKKNISGAQFTQPAESFSVQSATSAIKYDFGHVQPPPGRYIGVDDALQIAIFTSQNGNNTTINVRMLGLDGLIHPLQFVVNPPNLRTVNLFRFQLMEGWILSAEVNGSATPTAQFWTYAVLSISRSPFGSFNQYDVLCAGYCYRDVPLCYPYSPIQRPTDGAGVLRGLQLANPAAGVDFTITVPAGARWRLVSLFATFTTAVAAGNRSVTLEYDDGAVPYMLSLSNFLQGPSIVNTYTVFDSAPIVNVPFNLQTQFALPSNQYLPPGHRIKSVTGNIQAADQWGNQQLQVMEWLDNA